MAKETKVLCREDMVGALRAITAEIAARAEEIVGTTTNLRDLTIHIYLDPCNYPNYDIDKNLIVFPNEYGSYE